ncbi:hypothetical protein F5Y15DRAFT_417366 [Xylariaceae sp. FL0016]|nr:hypothetical protein F5Y15DRAFT_417366 [Xylariaceae sp. FL0016]
MMVAGYGKSPSEIGYPITLLEAAFTASATATAWSKTAFALTLLSLSKHWSLKLFLWCSTCGTERRPDAQRLPGVCWELSTYRNLMFAQAAYSGFMDLALAAIPWALIWKAPLRLGEKIGLGIAMSLGIFACMSVLSRIAFLAELMTTRNQTWVVAKIAITSVVEPAATVIAQSIPVFRVLLRGHRVDKHIATNTTAELRYSLPAASTARTTPENPFVGLDLDFESDISLHLIKRPDGRIVLAPEPGAEDESTKPHT